MILLTALALTAVGFAAWIVGSVFGYTEVAVIGAAIILGVGAVILTAGLEIRTGQIEELSYANETGPDGNESLVNNQTDIDYQYQTLSVMEEFQVGLLWLLLGAVLALRPLNALNE